MTQEENIARRCQEGDRQAQRLLYEIYAQWLLGVCLRYTGDHDTAQDLLQDGFVQILTQIDKFKWRGEGSLKAWVYRVQQNVILMYLRKNEQYQSTLSLDENLETVENIPEPESVNDIPHRTLMEMITSLPPGYRTIFNLYVIDGHSHKEIAQMLGIGEKTSASQLVHARRILANKINEWRNQNL